jgi:hypothetical protein
MAVCLLPGTELSFSADVACSRGSLFGWRDRVIHRTAILRQINKGTAAAHHDALEFPDGEIAPNTTVRRPAGHGSSVTGAENRR